MTRKLAVSTGVVVSVAASVVLVAGLGTANRSAASCGLDPERGPADSQSEVARGRGIAALAGNRIVMVEASGERKAFRHPGNRIGVLRHGANRPGVGTAYVNDLAGPDEVVLVTPDRVLDVTESGEVTHPTVSAEGDLAFVVDLGLVRVRSREGGVRDIARPAGTVAVFSPVFSSSRTITAVAQEPAGRTHDDGLDNLFSFDSVAGTWVKLTNFSSDGDAWTVIRTPIASDDGTVRFVVVRGIGSVAASPAFELWSLQPGEGPSKLRDLPGEMYLAGADGDRIVWNVYDDASGDWRLRAEGPQGLEDLGCGAVEVDPRAQVDPDLREDAEASEGAGHDDPQGLEYVTTSPGAPVDLAVLVGDFASRAEAQTVSSLVATKIGGAEVVNHALAPTAVAPRAWAVVVRVPAGRDAQAELARFRSLFPRFAEISWIVALGHGLVHE